MYNAVAMYKQSNCITYTARSRAHACRLKRDVRTQKRKKSDNEQNSSSNNNEKKNELQQERDMSSVAVAVVHENPRATIETFDGEEKAYNSLFIVPFNLRAERISSFKTHTHSHSHMKMFCAQITSISTINNRHFVSLFDGDFSNPWQLLMLLFSSRCIFYCQRCRFLHFFFRCLRAETGPNAVEKMKYSRIKIDSFHCKRFVCLSFEMVLHMICTCSSWLMLLVGIQVS